MKAISFKAMTTLLGVLVPLFSQAFSLLGPLEPWMTETNNYGRPGDIGGPMDITNGYRWNTPVITYSFDQSFLNYFGSNGVAAVNSAIKILNDLPPASQIVLSNFPTDARGLNYTAQSLSLYDLKSTTLFLLLEQLGLTSPSRYCYTLDGWDPSLFVYGGGGFWVGVSGTNYQFNSNPQDPGGHVFDFIIHRNYDPETFTPSFSVNDVLLGASVYSEMSAPNDYYPTEFNFTIPFPVDPFATSYSAVADFVSAFTQGQGQFYTGLTKDDVGGLRYLLATNNYKVENLLPDVHGTGTNANDWVDGALRGGVDKITFVEAPMNSFLGTFFSPVTNRYTDTYRTNGMPKRQQLERVTSRPDIVFTMEDEMTPALSIMDRTGTTNWINNAALNGSPGGAGPGMVRPGIRIAFTKISHAYWSQGASDGPQSVTLGLAPWSSYDGSTNDPILYPINLPGIHQTEFQLRLRFGSKEQNFIWQPGGGSDAVFAMQVSTNLVDWTSAFAVPNDGSVCRYYVVDPASPNRFYRVIQQ